MSSLLWSIQWNWGAYLLDESIEENVIRAIRSKVDGRLIDTNDVGKHLSNIPISINGSKTSFSARLEQIDPPSLTEVTDRTEIKIRVVTDFDDPVPLPKSDDTEPSLAKDLDEMVMFQSVFDPRLKNEYYFQLFDSLVGIPKDQILREMVSLLTPVKIRELWSRKHYRIVVPSVQITTNKAPVIVLGGDPGTGKTALATCIGAPLAKELGEKVHFRHLSLMLRGMGYQGRASGMIVKLFEQIKLEYKNIQEPLILFFDEAEAVVGTRRGTDSSSGAQENIAVVDAVIVGVDSLRKGLHARVVALFATNLTERIDSALMRRSYYHLFDRPDDKTRYQLFENYLSGMDFAQADIEELVAATSPRMIDGNETPFTPSDIVERIIGRTINQAIHEDIPVKKELLLHYCKNTIPTRLPES